MTPAETLALADSLKVAFTVDGPRLLARPKANVTAELADAIRENKPVLLTAWYRVDPAQAWRATVERMVADSHLTPDEAEALMNADVTYEYGPSG